jgi:hypothetical protein
MSSWRWPTFGSVLMVSDVHQALGGRVPECQLAPSSLILFDLDGPQYVLELAEEAIEAVVDVFVARELTGDAHDWEVVAFLVAQVEAPDVANLLRSGRMALASEAGLDQGVRINHFAVTADEADVGALRRLGILLFGLYRDPDRLAELIRDADPELFHDTYEVFDRFR